MKKSISLVSLSALAIIGAGVVLTAPAWANDEARTEHPVRAAVAQTTADRFWGSAEIEHDDDDNRRYGALPHPSRNALADIGMVRVLEVEWDDGLIEIEGVDARGREIDAVMDRTGQRVIRHKVERWDD